MHTTSSPRPRSDGLNFLLEALRTRPCARRGISLLSLAPMRLVFAGIDGGWANADHEDVEVFLARLKNSRWSMKRAAYDALHQLIMAAWYADPRTWASIGYPGPPRLT